MVNKSATTNLDSLVDLKCLTLQTVLPCLSFLAENHTLYFNMAMLFLTTGISPSRAWVVTDTSIPADVDDSVYLHKGSHTLVYRVLKGSTGDNDDWEGENGITEGIMRLQLPACILEPVAQALDKHKMAILVKGFYECCWAFSRHQPGKPVTARRLAITQRVIFGRGLFNDIERATINGTFRARHGAAGAYVSLGVADLNQKFRQAFLAFIGTVSAKTSPAAQALFQQMYFPEELPSGRVGSAVEISADDFQTLFHSIAEEGKKAYTQARIAPAVDRLPILARSINLQNTYLYMLQQVGLALRPAGPQSGIVFAGLREGVLAGDKDANGRHLRNLRAIPPALARQMEACHAAFNEFLALTTALNMPMTISYPGPLAIYISHCARKKAVVVLRMHHPNFLSTLTEAGIYEK